MYFLAICVHDHMLSHIRDAKKPKEGWEHLEKIFTANTTACKLQLQQELNNINVNEDEMVQVCLGGLAQRFDPIRITILAREKPHSFFNLQSMLLV